MILYYRKNDEILVAEGVDMYPFMLSFTFDLCIDYFAQGEIISTFIALYCTII